ncbi:tetratricopeptide repeat protein [Cyanobium sp. WAJ14-Wanaka]|uniref:tetratricopeptide repeat protein n=1 Tax=Cyanobium sp. WAJ14-Wanaka TaxID=2823725 RepID=UPI0020CF58F0|nr:tetratricopeptide repeat protein [Cyanobium sp. WAJ14-Wanaka]MCP9775554.1 tetratricopeptide repeat protein [Cyanobium sp. WAJ14-Wanaka]
MAPRWLRAGVAAPLMLGLSLGNLPAARANLVPYVYIPQRVELEGAGLGIAQAASRLLRLGQAAEAAQLAALTVQLLPDDPRGWLLLAEAQLRSKQLKEAGTSLARAKELDPRNPGIWFAQGSLALREGKPEAAIELLGQGLKLDSNNAGAYFDIGNAHIQLAQPGPALKAFEQAAKLRRDFWEAINNQGLVLFDMGKTKEALGRWRQVLSLKPDAAETNLALATGLFSEAAGRQDSKYQEALALANKALAADPNYVLDSYQKDQLWGPKLRLITQELLQQSGLKAAVERALANANPDGNEEE